MNLTIKLTGITPEQLFFVCVAIDIEYKIPTPKMKKSLLSYYSILEDVRAKLQRKFIATKDKKKFSITLKYHEANALYETLRFLGYEPEAQQFFDQLDQKLI